MILEEIKKGESKTLEFKQELIDSKKLAKTIVAFSNTSGGKFVIGVADNKEIIGVDKDTIPETIDKIANIIDDTCAPQIRPHIYTENINGKIIIIIETFAGYQKPYYIKNEGINEGVYIRIASTTRKADKTTIRNLERTRENIGYDEEINHNITRDYDAETKFYADFETYAKKSISEKDLFNLKLLKEVNGESIPTNAYGLFIKPSDLEHGIIKCARFKGTTTTHFIDRKEIELPVYKQIEQAMSFAQMYIALGSTIVGVRRIDKYAMPMDAIREAIANAVTHRDYSRNNAFIMLNIFDDRLEITSPGELPGLLSIDQIKTGRSEIRNRVVAKILKQMGFIEEWGTGINRIITISQEWGVKEPVFEEIGQSFRATVFAQ